MSDAAAVLQTADLGNTLGTLFFLVVFFIAPVIKQVLTERKKQATLDESRQKREQRGRGESAGLPGPLDVDDEPTPPFPWEVVERQDVAPEAPRPVPVPAQAQAQTETHSVFEDSDGIPLEPQELLAEADWAPLQQQTGLESLSPQEALRLLERRRSARSARPARRVLRDWRAAVVTAELLAPPVSLRGPAAGPGPGLGAPAGLG